MPSPSNKEVKDTISESQTEPPEMVWDIQAGKRDIKAFWEAMFIRVLAVTQRIHIQKLNPRTKGPCLIYSCKQVTEAKSKL
jgi:hypothetical protein